VATSIIKDMNHPPALQTHTTMRVWKYSTGQHLGTITIANRSMADGMMDTRRVPNAKAQFWVTNGLGMCEFHSILAVLGLGRTLLHAASQRVAEFATIPPTISQLQSTGLMRGT
jgi:hypothetical protein